MATITYFPSQAIVDTFAGTIDFYYWKTIVVARKWPYWPRRSATGLEEESQANFAYAARMWKWLPTFLKDQYIKMAVSAGVTGRDIFTRAYLNASAF